MRNKTSKAAVALSTVIVGVLLSTGVAFAQAVTTPEGLATSAGTSMRDTGIAVIAVLIPLAVALALAKMALPWAKKFLKIGG
jgi:hypothetical protein